ncbi:hypothetical protein [Achromobacter xylosoxidans]|uniref:hypothetical protein n=1 Tax=Alcaligenes xylosoxydans xylosoxydans TaxID=85698 RepID=UPI001402B066|nr:hypothetical protein [Achromobacter xylosoxidans]MBC9904868.1 hypothetical protein [Achromobacter xylosoxidans]MBD0868784.1 hypothetical protein [Achromobacter xylosoxidans]QNP87718.1 hypothetical protein IAG39_09495 [Achromobacter xylosoxidans]
MALGHHRAYRAVPYAINYPRRLVGPALHAVVAVALIPIGNYFTHRYVAADPWKAT